MSRGIQRRPRPSVSFLAANDAGTGLGLSVVSGIIRDRRGEVAITSASGQGTTVTLRLPVEG